MTGERTLPGAGLTGYWNLGDSSWKPGMDTNLRAVSALLQLTVKTRTTALPGSPAQGDMHLVPSGASVSPNQIALYDSAAWVYVAPRLGTRAFVQDESKFYWWNGTAWTLETSGGADGSYKGAYVAAGGAQTRTFDAGTIPSEFTWTNGTGSIVSRADATAGTTNALRFATITGSQTTKFSFPANATLTTNTLTIRYETSSESLCDYFRVWIDGVEVYTDSGTGSGFEQYSTTLAPGAHTIELRYTKDGSVDTGSDTTWISKIVYPNGDAGAVYAVGDTVTYGGVTWYCTTANASDTPSTSSTQWAPFDSGTATLAGDVTGAVGATTVAKIRGVNVSATTPTTNQVLKFDGTNWAPAADASATAVTMAGDVTGPSGTSVVVALQGRAVAATAPSDGQAIVWDATGTTWKPATVASGSTSPLTTKGDLHTYTTVDARLGIGTNGQILTADSTQASGLKWVAPSYDLPVYIPDKPTTSMICARIAVVRAFDLPVSLTGSVASAGTAATASTVFTLYKNTTSIGTVTFAAAGTTGTFSFASAVSFAAGDVVRIIAPATADTTLADISITLMGSRT